MGRNRHNQPYRHCHPSACLLLFDGLRQVRCSLHLLDVSLFTFGRRPARKNIVLAVRRPSRVDHPADTCPNETKACMYHCTTSKIVLTDLRGHPHYFHSTYLPSLFLSVSLSVSLPPPLPCRPPPVENLVIIPMVFSSCTRVSSVFASTIPLSPSRVRLGVRPSEGAGGVGVSQRCPPTRGRTLLPPAP